MSRSSDSFTSLTSTSSISSLSEFFIDDSDELDDSDYESESEKNIISSVMSEPLDDVFGSVSIPTTFAESKDFFSVESVDDSLYSLRDSAALSYTSSRPPTILPESIEVCDDLDAKCSAGGLNTNSVVAFLGPPTYLAHSKQTRYNMKKMQLLFKLPNLFIHNCSDNIDGVDSTDNVGNTDSAYDIKGTVSDVGEIKDGDAGAKPVDVDGDAGAKPVDYKKGIREIHISCKPQRILHTIIRTYFHKIKEAFKIIGGVCGSDHRTVLSHVLSRTKQYASSAKTPDPSIQVTKIWFSIIHNLQSQVVDEIKRRDLFVKEIMQVVLNLQSDALPEVAKILMKYIIKHESKYDIDVCRVPYHEYTAVHLHPFLENRVVVSKLVFEDFQRATICCFSNALSRLTVPIAIGRDPNVKQRFMSIAKTLPTRKDIRRFGVPILKTNAKYILSHKWESASQLREPEAILNVLLARRK